MASIICCACVFANPTYLATPAQNYLRIEPKVRSTPYRILLMALFTAVSRLVRGLFFCALCMMRISGYFWLAPRRIRHIVLQV